MNHQKAVEDMVSRLIEFIPGAVEVAAKVAATNIPRQGMPDTVTLNRVEFAALCSLAMIGVGVVEAEKTRRLEGN